MVALASQTTGGAASSPVAAMVGPHSSRPHGSASMPLQLPRLVALAEAAKLAASEHDAGHSVRDVVQAVEMVFASPGVWVETRSQWKYVFVWALYAAQMQIRTAKLIH